jgi:PAS domain S-box-containing protein
VTWNSAVTTLFGYNADEVGLDCAWWAARIHADDRERVLSGVQGVLDSGERYWSGEYRFQCKDGSYRQVMDRGFVVQDDTGKPLRMIGSMMDISALKQAESSLRESEERYRMLFESNPHAMWVADLETLRFLAVNDAAVATYGFTRDEFMNLTLKEIRPPEDVPVLLEDLAKTADQERTLSVWRHRKKDGTLMQMEILSLLITFQGRKAKLVVAEDITARQQAEEALRESEARFRAMNEASPLGIFMTDAEGNSIYSNATTLRIGDRLDDAVAEKNWAERIHTEDRQMVLDKWQAALQKQATYENEYRLLHRDGRIVWVSVKAAPIRDGDKLLGYVGTIDDISERKQTQDALAAERNLLRTVIDNLPDYVFAKDTEGRFILSNLAHALAAGFTETAPLIGKKASEVFPPELAAQFVKDDSDVLQEGRPLVNVERQTVDHTGRQRWVLTTKVPLVDEHFNVVGLVGISRDITHRKEADSRLLELGLERERVRLLERFIGDASHDLRTPLTIMRTSLHLLERQPDPEKRQRHVERLNGEVDRLAYLLEQMLTVTWLDRTTIEFDDEPQDLNTLVQEIVSAQMPLALRQNLRLDFTPTFEIPDLRMNRDELKRAIRHLLDNALSYTPEYGSVTVTTGMRGQQVYVEVRDTGIGITSGELPLIFERFYRADKARSAKTGGMGLGLPIAKRIVEAHGGSITVESAPGEGSTFRILLPA